MNKTKVNPTHTPGPWKSKGNGDIVGRDTWIASVGTFTDSGTDSDEACKANARLIAAAPELLEFAKATVLRGHTRPGDCYSNDYEGKCICGHDQAEQLIAKAESR